MLVRCLGCMEEMDTSLGVCPHCGYVVGTEAAEAVQLTPGTLIHGRYLIGKALGFGGFGVTYLAWDNKLQQKVAIKEYLPGEFSTRMPGVSQVTVFSGDKSEQYKAGLLKFVEEARHLARFQNEAGIVRIFDSFTENDTAYIIMEYLDGMNLADYLNQVGTIPAEDAVALLKPVMESLKAVHAEGLLHRDIAPDNIFITKDGKIKLIDFGASRFATTSHSRSLTVIIKPGFSPEEQYRSRGDQGPHTDVYALAATLYKMITGKTPPDALERRAKYENQNKDILVEPHRLCKNISPVYEVAFLNALNVRIEDRTASVADFMEELFADSPAKRRYGKIKKLDFYRWPVWAKVLVPGAAALVLGFTALLVTGVIRFANEQSKIAALTGYETMPDVRSLTQAEAVEQLKKKGFTNVEVGERNSNYVKDGYVMSQSAQPGTYIQKSTWITIYVSKGSVFSNIVLPQNGIATVPDFINVAEEELEELLKQVGLKAQIVYDYDLEMEEGLVFKQDIEEGEKVPVDTVITLTVSIGPGKFVMPNLCGKTLEEAKAIAAEYSLHVSVSYEKNNEVADNLVFKQSIAAGAEIQRKSELILYVSTGKESVVVPNIVGKTTEEAKSILEDLGFVVSVSPAAYHDEVASGCIFHQSENAGLSLFYGETIVIYPSLGKQPVEVTLDLAGGSASITSFTAYHSATYEALPTPTRVGYTFKGWFTQATGGVGVSNTTIVTAEVDHTIYAQWTPITYTICFHNGVSETYSRQGTYDELVSLDAGFTKANSAILGWDTSSNGSAVVYGKNASIKNLASSQDACVNLYAVWETITLNKTSVTLKRTVTGVSVPDQDVLCDSQSTRYGTIYYSNPTASLNATVTPNVGVTWSSSNSNVATVSNGTITAVGKGTCTITATSANGAKATCTVTVNKVSPYKIEWGSSDGQIAGISSHTVVAGVESDTLNFVINSRAGGTVAIAVWIDDNTYDDLFTVRVSGYK